MERTYMTVLWTRMGKFYLELYIPSLLPGCCHRIDMDSNDLRPGTSDRRSLSLTPELDAEPTVTTVKHSVAGKRALTPSDMGSHRQISRQRVAKRSKPTYDTVLDSHVKETLGAANPLGRKAAKQKSKKDRKAAMRARRNQGEGMLVDDNVREVVPFTFNIPDQT